jgi:hypothetical protein
MLGSDERRAAERILADAWGEAVAVRAAEVVAGRRHVVRLSADDGRTATLSGAELGTAAAAGVTSPRA